MNFAKFFNNVCFIILFSLLLSSCSVPMSKGQSWLDSETKPPNINVSGTWICQEFSMAQLNQDGRNITGAFYSGGLIKGSVSGNKIYLLIYDKDIVVYAAELNLVDQKTMTGYYVPGLWIENKEWWPRYSRVINMIKMPSK